MTDRRVEAARTAVPGVPPPAPRAGTGFPADSGPPAALRRPQRRGAQAPAGCQTPARPAQPSTASQVDFTAGSMPHLTDAEVMRAGTEEGGQALAPGTMRPLARALLAVAVELHADLQRLPSPGHGLRAPH